VERLGRQTSMHYFSRSGETGMNSTKTCRDTLRRICVFASGAICDSRSAFLCVQGVKRRHTNFHSRVGLV
jgi:hypothetical protein